MKDVLNFFQPILMWFCRFITIISAVFGIKGIIKLDKKLVVEGLINCLLFGVLSLVFYYV